MASSYYPCESHLELVFVVATVYSSTNRKISKRREPNQSYCISGEIEIPLCWIQRSF